VIVGVGGGRGRQRGEGAISVGEGERRDEGEQWCLGPEGRNDKGMKKSANGEGTVSNTASTPHQTRANESGMGDTRRGERREE